MLRNTLNYSRTVIYRPKAGAIKNFVQFVTSPSSLFLLLFQKSFDDTLNLMLCISFTGAPVYILKIWNAKILAESFPTLWSPTQTCLFDYHYTFAVIQFDYQIILKGLNIGKFPTLVTQQEFLESKVNETKAMVKFKLKKDLCMSVAVGNYRMEGSRSSRTSK